MTAIGNSGIKGRAAPAANRMDPTMNVIAIHQPESFGAHKTRGMKNW
jgi:hypothetical protein